MAFHIYVRVSERKEYVYQYIDTYYKYILIIHNLCFV